MLRKFKNNIIVSVWLVSLLSVNLSASHNLSKQELDAFMGIITNFILSDTVDKTAPIFTTSSSITVEEHQTSAYRVKVSDASPVEFSLSGADSAYFEIDTSSGIITFKHAPNYQTKNTYRFTIKATDSSGNSSTQSVTIHIRNPALDKPKQTGQIAVDVKYDDGYYKRGLVHSYTRNNITHVVTDNITGLQWQDDTRVKTVHTTNIATAIAYCKNLNLDGNGWRLPSIQELNTIIMRGKPRPHLHSKFSNYINQMFVTSTKIADGLFGSFKSAYWTVDTNGHISYQNSYNADYYMRCVR